ncbi:CoA-binding protein [Bacteroidetes bacterium UKL13-3]|jgi:predicted CoA-binding protein|nr:CoA-binding protein [Bacteroidetes bacterium UKL13-3]HCP94403.1 CoA-binding protein [Bacteroidota bacterium]
MKKKTLVLGASPNPERYGYKATEMLSEYGHTVIPFGIRKGEINGKPMVNELPKDTDFDTVTLYLNPTHQREYHDYIIGLHPKRVVFNPGTENPEFEQQLIENGIQSLEACTLVLLRTGQY